jgi:hypothetical protein
MVSNCSSTMVKISVRRLWALEAHCAGEIGNAYKIADLTYRMRCHCPAAGPPTTFYSFVPSAGNHPPQVYSSTGVAPHRRSHSTQQYHNYNETANSQEPTFPVPGITPVPIAAGLNPLTYNPWPNLTPPSGRFPWDPPAHQASVYSTSMGARTSIATANPTEPSVASSLPATGTPSFVPAAWSNTTFSFRTT